MNDAIKRVNTPAVFAVELKRAIKWNMGLAHRGESRC